jgi:hypothetical protein
MNCHMSCLVPSDGTARRRMPNVKWCRLYCGGWQAPLWYRVLIPVLVMFTVLVYIGTCKTLIPVIYLVQVRRRYDFHVQAIAIEKSIWGNWNTFVWDNMSGIKIANSTISFYLALQWYAWFVLSTLTCCLVAPNLAWRNICGQMVSNGMTFCC